MFFIFWNPVDVWNNKGPTELQSEEMAVIEDLREQF